MKITTYQQNARMLWEAHRVIHQQNMERLAELNRQAELQKKAYEIKTQWVKVNQVDIMAWDIYFFYFCWLAVKTDTDTSARILISSMLKNVKSLSAYLLSNAQNT